VRFEGSIVRAAGRQEGEPSAWRSSINGTCSKDHAMRAEAMARVEFELACTGDAFVASYAGYKAHRHKNAFSKAVDELRPASV
jgi:hypothetical protein